MFHFRRKMKVHLTVVLLEKLSFFQKEAVWVVFPSSLSFVFGSFSSSSSSCFRRIRVCRLSGLWFSFGGVRTMTADKRVSLCLKIENETWVLIDSCSAAAIHRPATELRRTLISSYEKTPNLRACNLTLLSSGCKVLYFSSFLAGFCA